MKNYILGLFFIISIANVSFGQAPGPPGCECCGGLPGTLFDVDTPLGACFAECEAWQGPGLYCDRVVPINSNILFLFVLALTFGSYSIYKANKERRLDN